MDEGLVRLRTQQLRQDRTLHARIHTCPCFGGNHTSLHSAYIFQVDKFLLVLHLMTVAALYEIIEWLSSLGNPEDTEAFLGTQGYIWDTQSDMFMCLCGAVIAILLLRTIHPWSSKTQTREGRQP